MDTLKYKYLANVSIISQHWIHFVNYSKILVISVIIGGEHHEGLYKIPRKCKRIK
jgi:hypothetical protein